MPDLSIFQFRPILKIIFLLSVFSFGHIFIYAQTAAAPPPPPPVQIRSVVAGNGSGVGYGDDEDDTKVTGATIRGRVFYEDTNRPARFIAIGLISDSAEFYNSYSTKYVKTDANGEFVIKNVKPGNYLPIIKSDGILTPEVVRKTAKDEYDQPSFEKVTIDGLGEIQVMVRAKRGGAVSGRIQYADGESAVGVKVEILKKQGERYGNVTPGYGEQSIGSAETDDRGIYRLTGLPAGTYIVRVIEPFSHGVSRAQYGYSLRNQEQSSLLRTYYPEGESSKKAKEIEVAPGQEQTDINIILPERQLFDLTGKIVSKKDRQPLENFTVNFYKQTDLDTGLVSNYEAGSINANKLGDWTMKNLPKGKYKVTVSQTYIYRQKESTEKQTEYPNVTREFEITDKNIDDIVFEIPVASSLSGTIVTEDGKPVPQNAVVFAFDEKTKQNFSSLHIYTQNSDNIKQSDRGKPFQISKMVAGNYKLSLSGNEYYVKSITLNGRDVTNSAIEVGESEDLGGVQIVVSTEMGTIKGKVNNFKAGIGMVAVAISPKFDVADLRGNTFSGAVGANGEFQIKTKPGEYAVIVFSFENRPRTATEAESFLRKAVENAPKVTVKANETYNVSLEMPN
ncbi:MAG: carboxypeptidase-like regulatory domain-containing protein [Pyrinomonadaceae bacterium]|nr:carboxypeptidase-like regulatory domain-containing protein [Pyrinomonadaceae bacterium]